MILSAEAMLVIKIKFARMKLKQEGKAFLQTASSSVILHRKKEA